MGIAEALTLGPMPGEAGRTKAIDPALVDRFCEVVAEILRRDFWDEKTSSVDQSAAAKAIGVSQPMLSRFYNKRERGVGLNTLLAFRAYERAHGYPRTLDSLLGLSADAPMAVAEAPDEMRALMAKLQELVNRPHITWDQFLQMTKGQVHVESGVHRRRGAKPSTMPPSTTSRRSKK